MRQRTVDVTLSCWVMRLHMAALLAHCCTSSGCRKKHEQLTVGCAGKYPRNVTILLPGGIAEMYHFSSTQSTGFSCLISRMKKHGKLI